METTDGELKIILDASPVGIVVFDRDARVLYANPLAERLFERQVTAAERIKCGDFIGCTRRHQVPQGCGHTQSCPACPLFRTICSACSDAPDGMQSEGEAYLDRDGDLPAKWIKYKVVGLTLNGRQEDGMRPNLRAVPSRRAKNQKTRCFASTAFPKGFTRPAGICRYWTA